MSRLTETRNKICKLVKDHERENNLSFSGRDVITKTKKDGTKLIFSGVQPQLKSFLTQNGMVKKLKDVKILPDIDSALREASLFLAG